ncbi:MAG: MFS transporter [Alphaproteobacteria bacterium]|nr:MFS transporter [Alphaproteobacteria bacterium]
MESRRRSLRGLDWFAFFVADVQGGFGTFVAFYLTSEKWTQIDIGFVLSVASVVSLVGQVPGGRLLDAMRSKRLAAAVAIGLIGMSALAYASLPIFPVILAASSLQAAASCLLGPAIAAMSLALVGHKAVGERFGRNARFQSIGAGLSAAIMGAVGYFFESHVVFLVTAAVVIPAWIALHFINPPQAPLPQANAPDTRREQDRPPLRLRDLLTWPLVIFGCAILLFHLSNAAMLPLMSGVLTKQVNEWAPVLIAACIVGPQLVVALCSPWAGRQAQRLGRRPILLLGLAALPIRGILFATVSNPYLLVIAQLLDGITATVFGVMVPLIIADLTRGTGRFNLTLGIVGTMMGIGASISTTLAGYITDTYSSAAAFFSLAAIAFVGLVVVALLMPETRPDEKEAPINQDDRA